MLRFCQNEFSLFIKQILTELLRVFVYYQIKPESSRGNEDKLVIRSVVTGKKFIEEKYFEETKHWAKQMKLAMQNNDVKDGKLTVILNEFCEV